MWWYENQDTVAHTFVYEPPHDKTNKMACAPSEDSDQPGHPPSLIRVFAVHIKKAWVLSYPLSTQRRLWSDWADAQAHLSLRWAQSNFVGFVMSWLISCHTASSIVNKSFLMCIYFFFIYCKIPKYSDTWNIAVIIPKFEQSGFTIE